MVFSAQWDPKTRFVSSSHKVRLITAGTCQRMVVAANLACCFSGAPLHCYFEGVVKGKWPARCLIGFREGWSYFCCFGAGSCAYSSRCTTCPEEEEVSSRVNTCDSKEVQSEAAPLLRRRWKWINPCLCVFSSEHQRHIPWRLVRLTDVSDVLTLASS